MNTTEPENGLASQDASDPRSRANLVDPLALMRIDNLELRAKVVVRGAQSGLHRSPLYGFSTEFSEYRQYSPGDDIRFVDWKLLARSDRYYVKRFEDETNLRCHVVLDISRSMEYGSLGFAKLDYAKTLAATLAYFLSSQRDAAGLVTFHDRVVDVLPPRFRPGHFHRLTMLLERASAGPDTNLAAPLEQLAAVVHRRSLIVIVSDLLAPLEAWDRQLAVLATRGHEVLVFRVLDPSEQTLALDAPAMVRDIETGREMYIDPETAREEYRRRFEEHADQLREICLRRGVDLHTTPCDRPLETALFDFLHARARISGRAARTAFGDRG